MVKGTNRLPPQSMDTAACARFDQEVLKYVNLVAATCRKAAEATVIVTQRESMKRWAGGIDQGHVLAQISNRGVWARRVKTPASPHEQYMGSIRTFHMSSAFLSSLGIIFLSSQSRLASSNALSQQAIPKPGASKAVPCLRDVFRATARVAAGSFPPVLSAFVPQLHDSRCRG